MKPFPLKRSLQENDLEETIAILENNVADWHIRVGEILPPRLGVRIERSRIATLFLVTALLHLICFGRFKKDRWWGKKSREFKALTWTPGSYFQKAAANLGWEMDSIAAFSNGTDEWCSDLFKHFPKKTYRLKKHFLFAKCYGLSLRKQMKTSICHRFHPENPLI